MNKNQILISVFLTAFFLNAFSLQLVIGTIQTDYYQNLDFNTEYNYDVAKFDSKLLWWGLDWSHKGDAEVSADGEIKVKIIGFSEKHPNDFSPFPDPAPYIDITFVRNTTFSNVANAEAANVMVIGFNYFDSGFIIPINKLSDVKTWAEVNADPGGEWDVKGTVSITESAPSITFHFISEDQFYDTELVYDLTTGILRFFKGQNPFGPDIEITLQEPSIIPGYSLLMVIGIFSISMAILTINLRKKLK